MNLHWCSPNKKGEHRPLGTMFPRGLKRIGLTNGHDLAERGTGREVDAADHRDKLVRQDPRLDQASVRAFGVLDPGFLLLERVALDKERPAVVGTNGPADLPGGQGQGEMPLREIAQRPTMRLRPLPERRRKLRPQRAGAEAAKLVRKLLGVDPDRNERESRLVR